MSIKVTRLISTPLFFNIPPKQFPDSSICSTCSRNLETGKSVYSEGSESSPYIFIGREPGELEVENNQPFFPGAPGGRLFMEYLTQLGLKRSEVYITNTLFCRGVSNRPPTPEETLKCLPYHSNEFLRFASKTLFVFPLGNNAITLVTGMASSAFYLQGECFLASNKGVHYFIFPLLHPGSILRKGSEKKKLFSILQEIRMFINKRGFSTKAFDVQGFL